jgi:hypothetical protein
LKVARIKWVISKGKYTGSESWEEAFGAKEQGVKFESNPLFLYLVGGKGVEPPTSGM